jgi:uncharacterized protein YjbI with pentapeptide repeats
MLTVFGVHAIARAQGQVAVFECAGCYLRGVDMSVNQFLGRDLSGAILRGALTYGGLTCGAQR